MLLLETKRFCCYKEFARVKESTMMRSCIKEYIGIAFSVCSKIKYASGTCQNSCIKVMVTSVQDIFLDIIFNCPLLKLWFSAYQIVIIKNFSFILITVIRMADQTNFQTAILCRIFILSHKKQQRMLCFSVVTGKVSTGS